MLCLMYSCYIRSHLRAKRAQQRAIRHVCMVARPLTKSKGKAALRRPLVLDPAARKTGGSRLRWIFRGATALALIAVLRITGGDFALLGLILEDGEYAGASSSGSTAAATSAAGPSREPSAQRKDDEL